MVPSNLYTQTTVTQLAKLFRIFPALLLGFGLTGCSVQEVCPGGWMTFFVDEQAGGPANHEGSVCDENTSCVPVNGFWKPCTGTSAYCGLPSFYTCLSPGDYTYTLSTFGDSEDVKEEGSFTLPQAVGTACKIRVYVNSGDPRLQTLSCGAGQILPHNAEGFVAPEGGTSAPPAEDAGTPQSDAPEGLDDATMEADGGAMNSDDAGSSADEADAEDAP